MVSKALLDQFYSAIDSQVSGLAARTQDQLLDFTVPLGVYLSSLATNDYGVVEHSGNNAAIVLGVEELFGKYLASSSFYSATSEFVSGFPSFVDHFEGMVSESSPNLPGVELTGEHRDVLVSHAAAASSVLEGHGVQTLLHLRKFLSRSLGSMTIPDLINGSLDTVRRISDVKQIAQDQLMLWFRLLGHLHYTRLENLGYDFAYRYVGETTENTRKICRKLALGSAMTRGEVSSLDTDGLDLFVNAGGHGCKHFWIGELV